MKCGIGTVDWYYVNWSCRLIYRLLISRFKRFLLTFWFISPDVLVDSPDVLVNVPAMLISWSTYWLTSPWCWSVRPSKCNVRKKVLSRISNEKTCLRMTCHKRFIVARLMFMAGRLLLKRELVENCLAVFSSKEKVLFKK